MIALTLEELMKHFDLPRLVGIHSRIDSARNSLNGKNEILEEDSVSFWLKFLKEVEAYCSDVHFHHATSAGREGLFRG
jgi:hypothetical protein